MNILTYIAIYTHSDRYCDSCLRRLYNQSVEAPFHDLIESDQYTIDTQPERNTWNCPSCRLLCTCANCKRRSINGDISDDEYDENKFLPMSPGKRTYSETNGAVIQQTNSTTKHGTPMKRSKALADSTNGVLYEQINTQTVDDCILQYNDNNVQSMNPNTLSNRALSYNNHAVLPNNLSVQTLHDQHNMMSSPMLALSPVDTHINHHSEKHNWSILSPTPQHHTHNQSRYINHKYNNLSQSYDATNLRTHYNSRVVTSHQPTQLQSLQQQINPSTPPNVVESPYHSTLPHIQSSLSEQLAWSNANNDTQSLQHNLTSQPNNSTSFYHSSHINSSPSTLDTVLDALSPTAATGLNSLSIQDTQRNTFTFSAANSRPTSANYRDIYDNNSSVGLLNTSADNIFSVNNSKLPSPNTSITRDMYKNENSNDLINPHDWMLSTQRSKSNQLHDELLDDTVTNYFHTG